MASDDIGIAVLGILFVSLAALGLGALFLMPAEHFRWQRETVTHGCAIYDCNTATGGCEWKWKEPTP